MNFKPTSSQLNFYTKNYTLDSNIWNQSLVQAFPKVYSYEQLNDAYNFLKRDHEGLRVKFKETEDGLVSYVEEYKHTNFPFIKVGSIEEMLEEEKKFVTAPMDFYGTLVNPIIFQTPTHSGVMIAAHHIAIDGYCSYILSKDINQYLKDPTYRATTQTHAEYIEREEKHKQSKRFLSDREFWKNQFSTKPECNILPNKNTTFDVTSGDLGKDIPAEFLERVKAFCADNDISPASFFNTVYAEYLRRVYNVENFTIGVPVLNRTTRAELNTIGLYMHIVPMVINLQPGSFIENAKRIEDSWLNIFRHQKFTQYDIKQMLREEDMPTNTLYDITADFLEFIPDDDYEIILPYGNNTTIPLEFHFQSFNKEKCELKLCYQKAYFSEKEVQTILDSVAAMLENTIANPFADINSIEMVSAQEKQRVLYDFNDTSVEYSKDKGVYELFESWAEKTPDKPAVIFKDIELTYSQLKDKVSECADRLCSLNIKSKDIVAVHLERSYELVVFQLAILKIGAIFLPVDKRYPVERIQQMCTNCDVKLLITDELDKSSVNANVMQLSDFKSVSSTKTVSAVKNLEDCYIIYTSGSTGIPKGCLLTGKGLLNFCLNNNTLETLNNINNPVFACVNSASFDYFIAETLLPLTNGFTTVVLDDNESTMQEQFLQAVTKNNINVVMTTPTRLKLYYNDKHNCDVLKQMACICTSGEPLTADLLEAMYNKSPDAMVYNPIGPSECSVWDMGGRLEKADGLDIHIGKPIANAQIYIVDKYMNPTPIGVTGEICIAGDGVGSGYINNPELTAEKFIENPFGEGKLYKTGDLGYWREDGNIFYVGRNDFQVKVNGLRIELGEIESSIEAIQGIERAVAVVRQDDDGRQLICAFYTGAKTDAKDFRVILGARLPKYMIPHIFTYLEMMPMTTSGKISRNNLPEIDLTSIDTETEYVAPETEEEKALVEAVETVLNIENVSVIDNFFNVGGDSITAIHIVSELEEKGYELHVADIMQSDTLAGIAKKMISNSNKVKYDQGEVNGFIPYTPVMCAYLNEKNEIAKDFVHTCIVEIECDEETARTAIDKLVLHHDMLRSTFNDDGIIIHSSSENKTYSFETITIEDTDKAIEYLKATTLEDKLVKAIFCKTEKGNMLCITIHHFIIDLVSWEVLMKDFTTVVNQLKDNAEIVFSAKTASFKLWNEELQKYSETITEENRAYWEKINNKLENAKSFCVDEAENDEEEYSYTFNKEISEKLINQVNNAYGTKTNEVLLTALGLAAAKIANGYVGITIESHGRTELHKPIAIERTIGWFTSWFPVVVNNNENIAEELVNVKETMRSILKNGVDYLLLSRCLHKKTDLIFNFIKNSLANENKENKLISFTDNVIIPNKISVSCFTKNNILTFSISVPKCRHKPQICEELGIEFKKQIEKIVDVCTTSKVVKTRSDFSDDELTESELNELKVWACDERNIKDIYGLTPSQEGMYAQYFQSVDTKTYQLQNVTKIDKGTDLELLRKSVEMLSVRHEVLKSAFTVLKSTGAIKQVILENRKPEFTVLSQGVPFTQEALDMVVSENTQNAFDLQRDSLFRIYVIEFTDQRFILVHAHHIIVDGWCFPVIINDLQKYYGKLAEGTSVAELTEDINKEKATSASYAQYANWIRKQDTKAVTEYWKSLLADSEITHIYGKEKKDNTKNEEFVKLTTYLNDSVSKNVERIAKENKITPNSVFECAFSIALQKFSGSDEIVYDKTISGRSIELKNIENTVGVFINTVPARIKTEENSTLGDLLQETQIQTINANTNGILSLAEVYKASNIEAKTIDTLFVFENFFDGESSDIANGVLSPKLVSFVEQTEFNLTVMILKETSCYTIVTSYAEEMYTEREIRSFIEGYISILTKSLDANKLIRDIEAISEDEKETLNTFNATEHEYDIPANTTLYSLFEEQAEKNADKVCIIANDEEITYKEFKAYAERLDNKIRSITSNEKSVIAVICERSFEMYGAVYGIIRGGNAYLPIDPNYPQERIDYILSNSNAKAVVAQDKFCHLAGNTPCINATEVLKSNEEPTKTEILANEKDTAYVIYTSGSTGNPKGAKISHKSAVNRILWMHDFYPLTENDVILQKTPYTFDVSVWELFWWGITGRTLCATKPDEHFLPAKILEETKNHKVTHLHFVPSVFDLFLTYLENNPDEQSKFNSVKYVFLSGEALTANSINRFYSIYDYNKVQLHNLYGPTECAVDVSYYPCVPTDIDPVPIGKPIYNTQLHIVDKYMNPTPIGVVGELCIAGVNVGQGYLNNEELTKEKFVANPFDNGKLYKTGDLAYWREDGQIIYCGRNDFQVKINGQRIELGEIEKVINEVEDIDSVAIMVMQNHGNDVLVAYCCGENIDETMIKEHCENKLPRYMVPSAFVALEKMPLNASGKLDRKQLKMIPVVFEEVVKEDPINDTERMICRIFAKTLKVDNIGRNESFFHMGGTSIDMISVLSENEMKNVSAAQFIANPTPKKLAELMDSGKNAISENFDVLREVEGSNKAMFVVPYAGGDATAFAKFVDSMSKVLPDISIYNVDYLHSYEECEKVADLIAGIGESHKLYIYSHCAGTAVALQIINILEEKGVKIANYIVGGYIPPKKPSNKNGWNKVPDKKIKRKLLSAGAPLEKFNDQQNYNMIGRFRKDTDFMVWYHYYNAKKISVQTDVVISKTDIFTRNYKEAESLWRLSAPRFNKVHYITTDSHYFQSDNSESLVKIIAEIIGE